MSEEKLSSFQSLLGLLRYARGRRAKVAAAVSCSVANKIFDIAPEILIGMAIDIVVRGEGSAMASFGIVEPLHQVYALGAVTFAIWAFESIFEYAYNLLWRGLAQDLQHELRMDAFRHLQELDAAYFEARSSGSLIAILNDDVNQLERFLNMGANDLVQVFVTVIGVGAVFFYISPEVAWMAFTPIPVILWGAFYFQRRVAPHYDVVREKVAVLSARLSNAITGIATIRSFSAEELEAERLDEDSRAYVEANQGAIRLSSAFIPIIRMAILFGFLCTLLRGGALVLDGTLEAGAYAVLVFLTQRLLWPLTRLADTVDLFERAMASTRRLLGLLGTESTIRDEGEFEFKEPARGEIAICGVDFAYPEGRPILHDIDLTLGAGETLALVGPTGGGKSSLVKLLLRFYEPSRGSIAIDGVPIESIRLRSLREQMAWVSQEVFLFDGTVYENIAYGKPNATREEVIEAAKAAEAHDFIEQLESGYETKIGERGVKLSGGQRQRISIARALLKDAAILLLDEATSAIDNETEAAIQRSLRRISRERSVIVVAHRLSTIVHADQIAVLERGRIVERGTHEELIKSAGPYASLWSVQTGAIAAE
ncbi:MAG: ABC transporter ATP-binding protein [Sandaracinaceae bacterium]|nr:ABC transporter ATP-binding protein [Sandaracinaceae bacterium]